MKLKSNTLELGMEQCQRVVMWLPTIVFTHFSMDTME